MAGKPVALHGAKFNVKSKAHVSTPPQLFFLSFFSPFFGNHFKIKKNLNFLSDASSVFCVAVV